MTCSFAPRPAAMLASTFAIAALLAGGFAASADARLPQATASASQTPSEPARPWLYESSDVPIDPAWRFGTLSNGLRYAIRRNGVPPGQLSMRVRIDVGSLMERSDELGFAHFLEHLTFRGSRHVPDGASKLIWQRLGVSFGSDSNARTTPISTTYALDLPDASPEGLEESVKILAGMMMEPNIVPAAIDAERAIVLAEMREGTDAASKVADASRALYFAGQPLGKNPPIGTEQTLNAATAKMLKAFHDRWYRPENTVIAIWRYRSGADGGADRETFRPLARPGCAYRTCGFRRARSFSPDQRRRRAGGFADKPVAGMAAAVGAEGRYGDL